MKKVRWFRLERFLKEKSVKLPTGPGKHKASGQSLKALAVPGAMLLCALFAGTLHADDFIVQGIRWIDSTSVGSSYSPQYQAQCQVDGVQVYEDLSLAGLNFSTNLTFNPGQLLECRVQAVNVVVPSAPVPSGWSSWAVATTATQPVVPTSGLIITIHQLP